MIQLDAQAQKHLDAYFRQVRMHLSGCRSVDPDEIERDVRQHIEQELQDTPGPVSFNDLDAVLKRLGSRAQWVPEEEISWWRKIVVRLRSGPEDWRLAYISFALFVLAFLFGPLLILASAIVSRAVISTVEDDTQLRAQKWLIYPSLIIVYLFVGFWLLCGPTLALCELAEEIDPYNIIVFPFDEHSDVAFWPIALMFIIAGTGLWWLILGCVHKRWPRLFPTIFRPFAQKLNVKWVNRFMGIAAALYVAFLVIGVLMIKYSGWGAIVKEWKYNTLIPGY